VSPDCYRVAWWSNRGMTIRMKDTVMSDASAMVINGQRGPSYTMLNSLVFSPDSKHFAYFGATKENAFRLVVDGKELPEDILGCYGLPVFSPDGEVAYVGTKDKEYWLVHHGTKSESYDGEEQICFSKDAKHVAFQGQRG